MQNSNSVPSPWLSKMEKATSQPISRLPQSSRDPPKKWSSFLQSSKWFIQHIEACMSLCYHSLKLPLAEAEWAPCTARQVSTHREHQHCLLAASDCLCISLSTGADIWPAQLQGQRWPIGADRGRSTPLGDCLFCMGMLHLHLIHTHNGDSLSLGFWILINFELLSRRHPKT